MMTTAEKTIPRLKTRYREEIAAGLQEDFSFDNVDAGAARGQGRGQHGCRRRRP